MPVVRYPDGGGLTAKEWAWREQVRLAAAELIEAGPGREAGEAGWPAGGCPLGVGVDEPAGPQRQVAGFGRGEGPLSAAPAVIWFTACSCVTRRGRRCSGIDTPTDALKKRLNYSWIRPGAAFTSL